MVEDDLCGIQSGDFPNLLSLAVHSNPFRRKDDDDNDDNSNNHPHSEKNNAIPTVLMDGFYHMKQCCPKLELLLVGNQRIGLDL